jgi:hypothetical protein
LPRARIARSIDISLICHFPNSRQPSSAAARITATEELIRPYIRRTPVIDIDSADFGLSPSRLTFKLEHLQHSGSFKARGAFANLLMREVPRVGVAAASGGNHGAAIAYAAMRLGKKATIFVPSISSPAKTQRIRDYGAELIIAGAHIADAFAACADWAATSCALPVHPFDQEETMLARAGGSGARGSGRRPRHRSRRPPLRALPAGAGRARRHRGQRRHYHRRRFRPLGPICAGNRERRRRDKTRPER